MTDRAWIATRKGLFTLHRKGADWNVAAVHFLGQPVTAVVVDARDGSVSAALNLGHFGAKLHVSHDDGQSWQEVAVPQYPAKPADSTDPVDWMLTQIWVLEADLAGPPGSLWAGTLPGGLFRAQDGGRTWTLCRALWDEPGRSAWFGGGYDVPGVHSVCVEPNQPERLLIGISCGGAWRSDDAGDHWRLTARGMRAGYFPVEQAFNENIQDPHRIARCRDHPEVLWCQHHCGIWRSEDYGDQWTEVTDVPLAHFGFAVAAHPEDPATAWFVPALSDELRVPVDARLAVLRTRDAGRSFEVLRQGLPNAACYDLVYRHGLDVDAEGTQLVMGSTTGGVWTSADAGTTWSALPTRLPPIYAARFG